MKRYNLFLEPASVKILAKIGAAKGGLKVAQVTRMAIQEFISRHSKAGKQ
jgi:hypothetical protein